MQSWSGQPLSLSSGSSRMPACERLDGRAGFPPCPQTLAAASCAVRSGVEAAGHPVVQNGGDFGSSVQQ